MSEEERKNHIERSNHCRRMLVHGIKRAKTIFPLPTDVKRGEPLDTNVCTSDFLHSLYVLTPPPPKRPTDPSGTHSRRQTTTASVSFSVPVSVSPRELSSRARTFLLSDCGAHQPEENSPGASLPQPHRIPDPGRPFDRSDGGDVVLGSHGRNWMVLELTRVPTTPPPPPQPPLIYQAAAHAPLASVAKAIQARREREREAGGSRSFQTLRRERAHLPRRYGPPFSSQVAPRVGSAPPPARGSDRVSAICSLRFRFYFIFFLGSQPGGMVCAARVSAAEG